MSHYTVPTFNRGKDDYFDLDKSSNSNISKTVM